MEMIGRRSHASIRRVPFRRAIVFLVLFAAAAVVARAGGPQEVKNKEPEADKEFKPRVLLLPLIYYTPETRLALGVGGVLNYRLGQDKGHARPSSLWLLMVYTMNNQIQLQLRPEIYLSKNTYILNATLKFERFPQRFYGVGNDVLVTAAEVYTPETIGFHLSVKRKVIGSVFGGIQYQLQRTLIQKVKPGGMIAQGDIPGSAGGIISGLGMSINYDNRDNLFFPRRGSYVQFVADFFSSPIGSDYHYSTSRLDLRTYVPVFSTHVLAFQVSLKNMGGNPPFYELSMLGGASMMRGNYSGQYRDKALFAVQAEYRLPVWKRFGAVAFAGLGDVGETLRAIKFNRLKYSLGGGLRYRLDSREGTNLRLDFAWGKASTGFYMTVQEAF
jgi:outer membrane protein assembly factor BamA